MNIIKDLDRLYKEWSGVSHLENSNKEVHDSAEAQDFARYCIDELKTRKSVPLTEEWLVKSKAEKIANTYHLDRFKLIWKPEYKFWYVLDLDSLTYLTKIEFVHEWQNFYFVMQGEELKFE